MAAPARPARDTPAARSAAPLARETKPLPDPRTATSPSSERAAASGAAGTGIPAERPSDTRTETGATRKPGSTELHGEASAPAQFDAAYLDNPKPEYPRMARRLGEEGTVLLSVFVSAQGEPEKIELHRSSGSPRLDRAARETVRSWKFVPARKGDRAVAAWVIVPITFELRG